MSRLPLGLKLWSTDGKLLPRAREVIGEGLFQYIELNVVPGTDPGPFRKARLPVVIHATTERWGCNIADPAKAALNRRLLGESLSWADLLGSELVVLHPGYGSLPDALGFLDEVGDGRIAIENMPATGMAGEPMVGSTPEEVRALRKGRFGFCLDLNHAIKASVSMGVDYRPLVREFLALGPAIFHISDGNLGTGKDEHLPLGEGQYDLAFLKNCIGVRGDARVTLETPRPSGSLGDDLQNRERFLRA